MVLEVRALVLQVTVHICICANNLCLDVNISSLFYMYGKYQVPDISSSPILPGGDGCGGMAASLRCPMAWRVCAVVYV